MLPSLDTSDLSPEALRALAEYLSKLSTEIRLQAEHIELSNCLSQVRKAKAERARAEFDHAGSMALAYVESGSPIETALKLVMAATGLDLEQARFAYSLAQRQRRKNRKTVIAWLKSRGWSDAKIGEAVGLHEKSVTRLRNRSAL